MRNFNMRRLFYLLAIITIAILLIASITYVALYVDFGGADLDKEAPFVESITKDSTATAGKIINIMVDFSDNVNVTEAIIFYKSASDLDWKSDSIIEGDFDLEIPKNPVEDYFYYIIVDDEAGNGPIGDPSINGSKYYTISVKEDKKELVHNVFIEEGTGSWCIKCPDVAEILYELYESGDYNFYYITLIEDANDEAKSRLENDYNIYQYPSVYIDGGYDRISGAKDESIFKEKISKAMIREVPELYLNVTTKQGETSEDINISVNIINYEDYEYNGRLKIYLTERISGQYYGGEGNYHFGYLDIIYDEDLKIKSKEEIIIDDKYDFSEYDVDNLMVIGVIFKSESVVKYSDEDNGYPYDAYYADASDGSIIVQDANLKPEVRITNPKKGRLHIFGREITATWSRNTVLIGRTTITISATDDSGLEKVELYIDDELIETFTKEPYEYLWKSTPLFSFKHDIRVIAYDNEGKTSESILDDVVAFILL